MHLTRRQFVFGLSAAFPASRALASLAGTTDDGRWHAVEQLGETFVSGQRAPGLSLAVSRNGVLLFAKGWGHSQLEPGTAVAPQTLFRIASVTKTFVGALYLRLAREGVLKLDDPAARWLPGFPRAGEFTVRMLLNHTSGLGEYTKRPFEALVRDAGRTYATEELLAYMAGVKPLFLHDPGTGWAYSNTGYVLLGVIAERAGGAPLPDLFKRYLTVSAGLRETAWDSESDHTHGYATGYGFRKGVWVRAPSVSTTYIGASGGIWSTARDLCQWFDGLFGARVLTSGELKEMTTPATLAGGRPTLTPKGSGYGLGIWTGKINGRKVAWHAGSTAGFAADARHYPDHQVSIVMLGNADTNRMGAEPARIRAAVLAALRL